MPKISRSLFVLAITLTSLAINLSCPIKADAQLNDPGDLRLAYDPDTGNLTVEYVGSGTLDISTLQIITLGDASESASFIMPSGIPGVTAGQGGLNQSTAPTLAGSFLTTLNNNADGFNGLYSEISYTALGTLFSFNTTTNSAIDLGNVASLGWSQANVDTIFMTSPALDSRSPQQPYFGKFTYTVAGGGGVQLGTVAVPEPSTLGLLAGAFLAPVAALFRNRKAKNQKVEN